MLTEPLKAATARSEDDIRYPCCATPKLDGIRGLVVNGQLLSKAFKPIRNAFIQRLCSSLPDGLDGELITPGTFQSTTSAVMSYAGEPKFTFMVFDRYHPTATYWERVHSLPQLPSFCSVLLPTVLYSKSAMLAYEADCLYVGYEGIVVRCAAGRYKCGRSSLNEHLLVKFKRVQDSEALVLAVHEGHTNLNPAVPNAFGRTKRPGSSFFRIPRGTMGSLECRDIHTGVPVSVGSGFDDSLRAAIWADPAGYVGRVVKYSYQSIGAKDAPRFPRFVCFMDPEAVTADPVEVA